uniref:Protein kinase domain-containing protein n=1 Tax=Romanomermis culicivorax TaxID=13658 RepID=A0A915HW13_ROMCU
QTCCSDDGQSAPKFGHFYVPHPTNGDEILTPLQNDIQQIDDNMIEMETTCKPPKVVHNHLIMDEIGSGAYARVKQCLLLGKMEPRAPPKVVHNHLIMHEIGSGAYARVKQCLLLGKMEPRAVKIFKIERKFYEQICNFSKKFSQ